MRRTMVASLGVLVAIITMLIATPSFPGTKLVSISQPPDDANSSTKFGTQQESPLPPPTVPADSIIDLGTYQFSEPQLIYEEKGPIWIGDWLPDNHSLLLTTYTDDGDTHQFEEIQLLDTTTGALQVLGRRNITFSRKPLWLADTQEVAYFGPNGEQKQDLLVPPFYMWIVTPGKTAARFELISEETIALAGRDHTLVAIQRGDGKIVEVDQQTGQVRDLALNVKEYGLDPTTPYIQMLWHPLLPLLAIFDLNGFIIVDLRTNEVKQIDLGEDNSEEYWGKRWAIDAQWNPTQEQMALNVGVGEPTLNSTRLFVLNTKTGVSKQIPVPIGWISDINWAPDGIQLLIRGKSESETNQAFYFVDTLSSKVQQITSLPSKDYDGLSGWNIRWSPDGSKLAWRYDNQLYLIKVEVQR